MNQEHVFPEKKKGKEKQWSLQRYTDCSNGDACADKNIEVHYYQ
jgi:hypothetical protein